MSTGCILFFSGQEEPVDEYQRTQDIKVLFMSGYPADIISKKNALEADSELIVKPFSGYELLKRVRQILDRPVP